MDTALFNKAITCPVCSKEFEVTKVKARSCKVESRDSDFCVKYEGINPLLYDVWVCEHCGYAALQDKFETIPSRDAQTILQQIAPKWSSRSFAGERSLDMAIEAFKIALYNLQVRKAKASEVAKICLRIAWLYRYGEDPRENDFIQFALRSYSETYEKERFPVDKMDELTCMYMIAELHRRAGDLDDSVKWFSRLIGSPDARRNARLLETARDQYQLVKEALKENKEEDQPEDGQQTV